MGGKDPDAGRRHMETKIYIFHRYVFIIIKKGRKRLDTPKRMIVRREREGEREKKKKMWEL